MELVFYHYRLLLLLLLTVGVIVEITVGLVLEKYYRFERKKRYWDRIIPGERVSSPGLSQNQFGVCQ